MRSKLWIILSVLLAIPSLAQSNSNGYAVPNSGVGNRVCIGPGSNFVTGVVVNYAGSCLTMTLQTKNFGYIDGVTGSLLVNTTGFPIDSIPVFTATTDQFQVTLVTDARVSFSGNANPIVQSSGAPTGTCAAIQTAVDTTTGNYYSCNAGVWSRVGNTSAPGVGSAIQQLFAINSGVVGEGHFSNNITATNTQNVVNCSTCHFLVNAKVGQIFFATNLSNSGFTPSSILVDAQGTISTVDSDTQIHVSNNFTATCVVTACTAVWGTDETTQMQTLWATAVSDQCASMIFPALNPEGTGPAVILVQASPGSATCPGGSSTGGTRNGLSIIGPGGPAATYIVPTPNFNSATCTTGASTLACFSVSLDGGHIYGMTFFGGGVSNPGAGFNNKIGFELDSINNSYMDNVQFLMWGAGTQAAGGLGIGFLINGQTIATNCDFDGWGGIGVKIGGTGGGSGNVWFNNASFYDNTYMNIFVNGGVTTPAVITNANIGSPTACSSCGSIGVMNTGTQSQLYLSQSMIGIFGSTQAANGIMVGTANVDGTITSGTGNAVISNVIINAGASSNTAITLFPNAGNTAHIRNIQFLGSAQAQYLAASNGDTIFDEGGNTFASTTPTTFLNNGGTGILRSDGHNISGACTGVVTAASTLGLYGTGPNETLTTCTSAAIGTGIVMQNAGTLRVLQATASAGGTNASSGVVTVLKNGGATAITCTLGTGTNCTDGLHTAAYVAGDLISFQFTSQAADTLAGVKANVTLY